jgi:subtilisin-like proprotein convertase family protein
VRTIQSLIVTAAVFIVVCSAAAQHRFIAYEGLNVPQSGLTTGRSQPYPAVIPVTGVRHPIASVRFSQFIMHTYPDDIDMVLVSPRGLAVVLLSDCGGSTDFSGTISIAQGAPAAPNDAPLVDGATYSPTDYDPGDLPPGLPTGLTFTTLAGLIGTDANGEWSVYVYDDGVNDVGLMSPPRLDIEEAYEGPVSIDEIAASIVIQDNTTIERSLIVGGVDGPIRNLVVRIFALSHEFPRDLDIALRDPQGRVYILMSDAGGSSPVNLVNLDFGVFPTPVPQNSLASGRYAAANYTDANSDINGLLGTSTTAGRNPSGEWRLIITDDAAQDSGSFSGWSLVFDAPCRADFNRDGLGSLQDLFDFLTSWFSGCP